MEEPVLRDKIRSIKEAVKIKTEFSKFIVVTAVIIALANLGLYWLAIFKGYEPDSAVPISSMVQIFGAILSYCLYQLGLKHSRNKYGIDENGQPYKENYEED